MKSVVSFGEGCAGNFPGIYGKVTEPETLEWIKGYMADSNSNTCSDPPRTRRKLNFRRRSNYKPESKSLDLDFI